MIGVPTSPRRLIASDASLRLAIYRGARCIEAEVAKRLELKNTSRCTCTRRADRAAPVVKAHDGTARRRRMTSSTGSGECGRSRPRPGARSAPPSSPTSTFSLSPTIEWSVVVFRARLAYLSSFFPSLPSMVEPLRQRRRQLVADSFYR